MEDILNKLRKNELQVSEVIMDVLLEAVDMVKLVLQDIIDKQQGRADISGIVEKLKQVYEGKSSSDENQKSDKTDASSENTQNETKTVGSDKEAEIKVSANSRQESKPVASDSNASGLQKSFTKKADSTIRVGVDRLDSLVNMVGELVLGRNALTQTTNQIQKAHEGEKYLESLQQASSQISFITTELHVAIMKMRMLQIGHVFNKFPRVVRDLSRELAKKIDLEIKGEETELDKSVIEEINDPLVHLIRNSVDHGIELPEERVKIGKPEQGTIKLSAYQEGNNIVIEVEDDGKGMDVEAIKKKAIERGLTTPEVLGRLSKREILNFIFQAGFTTAKKTTNVSGRGVGMDVVRTNIER